MLQWPMESAEDSEDDDWGDVPDAFTQLLADSSVRCHTNHCRAPIQITAAGRGIHNTATRGFVQITATSGHCFPPTIID